MRKQRGNIILTALFVAIFLFFLSVALIWTNRQDIALSLSMEHKLKAQSAARTGAYEAFARLREFGELGNFRDNVLPNGAEITVELVAKDAVGKRGEVLQIRARGKSGPVTSYLTLHLSDTRLAGKANESDSRVLFFPNSAAASGSEGEETSETSSGAKALYGDFILKDGGPGALPGMVANAGPVFASQEIEAEPPYFQAVIPVFSEDLQSVSAWGPTYLVLPPHSETEGHHDRATDLRQLVLQGEEFQWESIEPPTSLGDEPAVIDPAPAPYVIEDEIALANWTTLSVRGIFEQTRHFGWRVDKPLSDDSEEIQQSLIAGPQSVTGNIKEWSEAPAVQAQQSFVTRGAIYAQGQAVYTHGWHYVYVPYDGRVPNNVGAQHGARVVRWPCILKYEKGSGWSEVWAPLGTDGSVRTEARPDPTVLLATNDGEIYTVTEPKEGQQRKLLTLTGKSTATVGDEVPDGQLVLYKEQPYLIPTSTNQPGLHELLSDQVIGFQTLPDRLPELFGEVLDVTGTEIVVLGLENTYQGEPLSTDNKMTVTARPRYDFSYRLLDTTKVAVDGDDLWAIVQIQIDQAEPTHPPGYNELTLNPGTRNVLARYDGERWHILPNGLRAALHSNLQAPGGDIVAAIYNGLPEQVSRYSVISVDTNPF